MSSRFCFRRFNHMPSAALFLLLVAAIAAPLSAAVFRQPNVLIVLTDDQGMGDFSCHGNPVLKTPNLDRLQGEAVRFTDFHVAPMCTPTRGQLMTGVDALRNGAMNVSSGRTARPLCGVVVGRGPARP